MIRKDKKGNDVQFLFFFLHFLCDHLQYYYMHAYRRIVLLQYREKIAAHALL